MSDDKAPNSGLIKAEIEKKNAEAFKIKISTITEGLKGLGIFIALALSLYANFTKADATDVKESQEKTTANIAVVAENVEEQHTQTEKIRETVVGHTSAVKAIASAAAEPTKPTIPISDSPVESGCWVIQGGIVKCKGVGNADITHAVKVSVAEAPPPAKAPKSIKK